MAKTKTKVTVKQVLRHVGTAPKTINRVFLHLSENTLLRITSLGNKWLMFSSAV